VERNIFQPKSSFSVVLHSRQCAATTSPRCIHRTSVYEGHNICWFPPFKKVLSGSFFFCFNEQWHSVYIVTYRIDLFQCLHLLPLVSIHYCPVFPRKVSFFPVTYCYMSRLDMYMGVHEGTSLRWMVDVDLGGVTSGYSSDVPVRQKLRCVSNSMICFK
jgi:hypothetical protein